MTNPTTDSQRLTVGHSIGEVVFAGCCWVLFLVLTLSANSITGVAKLLPRGVAVFGLALMTVVLVMEARKLIKAVRQSRTADGEQDEGQAPDGTGGLGGHWVGLAWVGVLGALTFVFGIIVAAVLFIGGYARLYGRDSWLASVLTALVIGALFYFVFGIVLEVIIYEGLLAND